MGSLFVIIGVVFFLKNLGIISQASWGVIWPLALIALGVYLIQKKHRFNIWRERIWRKLE